MTCTCGNIIVTDLGDTLCQSEKFVTTPLQLNVFQLDSFVVLDIDECASATYNCSDNAV